MFIAEDKGKTKEENYELILENQKYLLIESDEFVTSLSNLSALLNYFLDDINWVGFYLYDGQKLYLGPFQGLPACTEIKMGIGVCGTTALEQKSYIVKNVHDFPGHIACDSNSSSEIVIPILKDNKLIGVLDIDSPTINRFNEIDKEYLEKVVSKLVDII